MKRARLRVLLSKAKKEGWSEWIRSEADERAMLDGCYFHLPSAEYVRDFFQGFLKHSKGAQWAGKPFILLDWEWREVIGPLFGWMRPDDEYGRRRRFRKCYVEVAKKNGKSPLAAGIGLYLLVADGEPGADIYSAATKREQAAFIHDEAVSMVRRCPELLKRVRINETTKTIYVPDTRSKYGTLAKDKAGAGAEGLQIHGLLRDEMHVWTDREFEQALKYAFAARRQPIEFTVTTAGRYDKASLGWQVHEYAQRVADGRTYDMEYLPFICAASKDDDITDPEVHKKANPSYGSIIDPEEIAKAAQDAREKPSELNAFMRYRLNIWVEQLEAWIPMHHWDQCAGAVDEAALVGRKCFGGLDLASKKDIVAFVLLFPPTDEDPLWRVLPRMWCPQEGAYARGRKDQVEYELWGKQGHLTLTPGNVVDYETVKQQIARDSKIFKLAAIGADKWNLEYLRQRLESDGVTMVEYGQNFHDMSPPSKELEALVVSHAIAHGGHPVLDWMAGNVTAITDGKENIQPSKKESPEKIDGIVALIMALGMAMLDDTTEYVLDEEYPL